MSYLSVLGLNALAVERGGGNLWIVEYDSTKNPYLAHCSLKTASAVSAVSLAAYTATASGSTDTTDDFGATGAEDVDIFGKDGGTPDLNKAHTALSSNTFTIAAMASAHALGSVIKKYSASDYTVADWKNLGHLDKQGTELKDELAFEKFQNELGEQVASAFGARDIEFIPMLMQCSKAEEDFLFEDAPNKNYAAKYVVPVPGVGVKVYVIRLCKLIAKSAQKFSPEGGNRVIAVSLVPFKDGVNVPYQRYMG